MKFTSIFLFFLSIISLGFAAAGPNARRLAQGLSPLPPKQFTSSSGTRSINRSPSRIRTAKRSTASNPPGQCIVGYRLCCVGYGYANDISFVIIQNFLGIFIKDNTIPLGDLCTPFTPGDDDDIACVEDNLNKLCCQNNDYNGYLATYCTPLDS